MDSHLSAEQLRAADPENLTQWEREWRNYFLAFPGVLASWGHQNGRRPAKEYCEPVDERNS